MSTRTVVNEFAKMRRLRAAPLLGVMVLGVAGLTAFQALGSGVLGSLDAPDGYAWKLLFGGLGLAVPLISPLAIAMLAGRQVEMEHSGGGWLLSAASGVTPGRLCRAKFLALGALVTAATCAQSLLLIAFGLLAGITSPFPGGLWLGCTASVAVVNLVVLALHLLLSARVENQLVGLGVGVLGVFAAIFTEALPAWAGHLTPWGFYFLAAGAGFAGERLVHLDPPYPSFLVLGLVGGCLFLYATARFDRREA